MTGANSTATPRYVWGIRIAGMAMLAYVLAMTFAVPLGPGLVDVATVRQEVTASSGVFELEITGHNTHFASNAPLVFLKNGDHIVNASAIKSLGENKIKCRIRVGKFLPARSWDVYVNNGMDGTMSYANGFFATDVATNPKASTDGDAAVLDYLSAPNLPFHFPFQPNIMETIRNLMLHVPMWFTMFLLMGISFAQSIRTLRLGGDTDRDLKAVASVKVGLWFGVLGLLTGSLWARFTWGAWWVDDPQLNGAFVTVLVYAGYLVLRASIQEPLLRARLSGVYNLFGFCLLVVLLMVLPRFTESLHPGKGGNPAFSSYDLDSALRLVFYPAVLGWMVLGTWMYSAALKAERLRHRLSEARLTKASMPLGMLLMTPPSTSGWEAWFLSAGKLNVVVGVAVIILAGLALWGWRMRRELKSLSEDLERLKTN